MWTFLLVGTAGAIGAALALGTMAAILRYRRTGAFPGADGGQVEPTRGQVVGLWVRVAVGGAVFVWAVASLQSRGLLGL